MFEEPDLNSRVLARLPAHDVLAASADVYFRDCSQITLHRVAEDGHVSTWLRAVAANPQQPAEHTLFDLRHVCADTAADMQAAHWLDVHGCFYYGLRTRWSGANALLRAIRAQQINLPAAEVAPELEMAA
jgi:hypothetical protein